MTTRSWIRRLLAPKPRTIRKDQAGFRPRLEALEDRALPSTITVLGIADGPGQFIGGPLPSDTTLRGAIAHAQSGDTIVFSTILTTFAPTTVNLSIVGDTSAGPSALAIPAGADLTIVGPTGNNGITIGRSGTTAFRLFDVAQGGSLTLENLTLTGGLAQGTGVAAEGGAIYSAGTLSLSNVTVQNNQAQGSNGTNPATVGAPGGAGASAYGGGLYVAAGTVALNDTTFSANRAQGGNGGHGGRGGFFGTGKPGPGGAAAGGGTYVAGGTVTLKNDTLKSNQANGGALGGGIQGGGHVYGGPGSGGGIDVAGGTVTLSNDTLKSNQANGGNSNTGSGGGIYVAAGTVSLNYDMLSSNQANGGNSILGLFPGPGGDAQGGGMAVAGGAVVLSHNTLSSNQAQGGEGATGLLKSGGGAASGGGICVAGGTITSSNDALKSNRASAGNSNIGSGGGVYVAAGSVSLNHDTLSGNQAQGGRGGAGGDPGGPARGGGMAVANGNVGLSDDTFDGNDANGGGGDSRVGGFSTPGGAGGVASGGGLYVGAGTVTLTDATLSSNQANGGPGGNAKGRSGGAGGVASGGAMAVAGGTVKVSNDTLNDNQANGGNSGSGSNGGGGGAAKGGAMAVANGIVTLSNDTLSSNQAIAGMGNDGSYGSGGAGGAASGGGVYVAAGTVTLSDDTLSRNQVEGAHGGTGGAATFGGPSPGGAGGAGSGGGLDVADGTVTLINDTLSSNQARGATGGQGGTAGTGGSGGNGQGGGLYLLKSNTTTLANTLIAQNTVTSGAGGAAGKGGTAGASGQTPGPDVCGTVVSSDHDLIGTSSDFVATQESGDILDLTPGQLKGLLDPRGLQDNGGPTRTIALATGSLAIDAGASNAPGLPSTDQRGFARIVGNGIDIGAYEYGSYVVTVTDAGGVYNGRSFPASATAVGFDGHNVSGKFSYTFYAGISASGTPLTGVPVNGGTYTVVATFTSTEAKYLSGGSAQTTFTISPDPTSISVSATNAAPVYGQSETLTATVTTPAGDAIPASDDGVVVFYDGVTMLGIAYLSGNPGTATLTTAALTAGAHTIRAAYSGDNNFVAGISGVEPTSTQVVFRLGLGGLPGTAWDAQGDGFFAEPNYSRVVEVKADGSQTTVGSGLFYPTGVAVDGQGDVFIDDAGRNLEFEVLAGLPVQVSPATPTVSVSDAGGTYTGKAFPATDSVAGVVTGVDNTPASTLEGVTPTLTYYQGTYTTLAALNTAVAGGVTGSSTAPRVAGSYTVVASFAGSTDYSSGQALATFSIGQATPTVSDPGFEGPSVGTGASAYKYGPTSGTPWTFSGLAGVAGNGSGFTSGNPSAPEGTQVAFLQKTGSVSQAVTFAASNYTISFSAAQRQNYQSSSQTIRVTVDGSVVGTITPSGTSYATYTTSTFTLTAGSHTIAFVGLNPNGGDNTAFLDQASIIKSVATVSDPGFEGPAVGTGASAYKYGPTSGTPWTFSGLAGVAGNGSGFTSGNPSAPEGTQVAFLQKTGSVSQAVTFAASNYTISFSAAQRQNYQSSYQEIEVLVDGNVVGTITPSGTSYGTYTTGSFSVTAGTHTIAFVGLNPNGGDNTAFLDQITIQ